MAENLPKLTVSELTSIIKDTLEGSFYGLTVEGEISGFKPSPTGHWYFSLKDQEAVISAVVWRTTAAGIGMIPRDGQRVVVTGNLGVYAPRGTYQLICTSMRSAGEGDILAMLEERKRRYALMGWFDESLKKPIPKNPSRVGVVTSQYGAALQDILQITGRRCPGLDIIILPALVQGMEAAGEIAARIYEANRFCLADVLIVGRGGGSVEDLLPFSEDAVIEAVHNSEIPVISAVGHETDWAISDFAADLRAPTPSAAAELVCKSRADIRDKNDSLKRSLLEIMNAKLREARLKTAALDTDSLRIRLEGRVLNARMKLDSCFDGLERCINDKISSMRNRTELLAHKLAALSPVSILERGYAIVTDRSGKTVDDPQKVKNGDLLNIRLKKGSVEAEVKNAG